MPPHMQWLSFVGMGSFVLTSFAVGVRLLWLAARNRGLPEALIGSGLLLVGAIGPAIITVGGTFVETHPERVAWAWGGGLLILNFGVAALYVFTWRVFYADSPRAAAIALLGIAIVFVGWAGQWMLSGFDTIGIRDPFAYASLGGRIGAMSWACHAALAQYESASRRVALGLADPIVANRFLLWATGSGSASVILTINLVRNLFGSYEANSLLSLTLIPALGMVAAIAMGLAFFPPRAYLRAIAVSSAAN